MSYIWYKYKSEYKYYISENCFSPFIEVGPVSNNYVDVNPLLRFDEFVRASTVAINNAKNKEKIAKYTSKLEELVQNRTKALEIQTVKAEVWRWWFS